MPYISKWLICIPIFCSRGHYFYHLKAIIIKQLIIDYNDQETIMIVIYVFMLFIMIVVYRPGLITSMARVHKLRLAIYQQTWAPMGWVSQSPCQASRRTRTERPSTTHLRWSPPLESCSSKCPQHSFQSQLIKIKLFQEIRMIDGKYGYLKLTVRNPYC